MNRLVAVAGAGGPAGQAVIRRLTADGVMVAGADVNDVRLREAIEGLPRAEGEVIDLLDAAAVRDWAARLEEKHGRIDGLVHLVGGWRGCATFAETSLDDWTVLHDLLIRTTQHTSMAFESALRRAEGRYVIVSALAAAHPTQGGAAYAAAKAAAEAWTLALADALKDTAAAAVIFVVKALGDKPGFTTPAGLADAIAELWNRPAAEVNGQRLVLAT